MSIINKTDLQDLLDALIVQFNVLFPDNNTGEISADDLRTHLQSLNDYLNEQLDSGDLQKPEPITVDLAVENWTDPDVDRNLYKIHNNGAPQTVNLPTISGVTEGITIRGITLTNNPVTFVPSGGDVVLGTATISRDGLYQIRAVATGEWAIFFLPFAEGSFIALADTPNDFTGHANKRVTVNVAEDALEFTAPDYVAAYFENLGLTTSNPGVDTWANINGTLTAGPKSTDLSVAGGAITYNGSLSKNFGFEVHASAQKASGSTAVHEIALAVNGVAMSPFFGATLNNADFIPMGASGVISLSPSDVVTAQMRVRVGAIDWIVRDLNIKLTEIS